MALYINIYRTKSVWANMKAGDFFVHEKTLPHTMEIALRDIRDNPEEYEYTIIESDDGIFTKINLLTEVEV